MDELSAEDQQIIRRCLDTIVSVVVDVQIGKFNVRRTKHPEGTIDKASVEAISECHNYSKRYEEENLNNKNDNPPSISNISEEAEQTKKPYNTRYKKKKQCSCGLANTNKQTNMPDPIDLTKLSSTNTFVPYQIKWKSPKCQDVGICMCQTKDEVEKQGTPGTTEKDGACSLGEKSNSSGKRSSLLPYLVNQKSEERGLSLLEEEETQILHYPWLRYRSQTREITTSENNLGYSVVQERGIQTMYADLPTDDEGEDERTSGYLMESDIRSTANSVLMEEGEEENNKSQFSLEDQKMNYSYASDDGGEEMEISKVNKSCADEELTQQPIKIEYINDEKIVVDSAEICRPKLNSGFNLMEPNPDDWTNLKHNYEYSTTLVNAYNSITKSHEMVEQDTSNEKYQADNQIPQNNFFDKNSGKQNEISTAMIEQGCQTVLNEMSTSDEEEDVKDVYQGYELENHVQPNHLNQIKLDCEKTQNMSCIDDIKSCASGQTDDSEKMKIYTAVPIDDILKMSDSKMSSSNLSDPRNDFPNINMKKRTLSETHSGYQKCFEESINLKNKLPGKTLQTTEPAKTLQTTEPAKTLQTAENNFNNILPTKTLQTTESKFKNILPAKTLQTTESNEINLVPIPVFRVTLTGDNYKYGYEQVGTEMPSATNEKALPDIPIEEENIMSIVDHQNETQIESPEDTEEFPENPCKGEELTNKFICKLYKECKDREGTINILHHCVCSVLNICIEKSTVNPCSLQMKAKKVFEKCRRLKKNTSRPAEFEAFENDLFILPRKKTETKNKVKLEIEGLKDEINNLLSLNEKLKKRQRIAIIKKKRLYQRMNKKNALIEKLSKK